MVEKIPEFFSDHFVLFGKYGKRYENEIWCRGNQSRYGWASIPSVFTFGVQIC
jgi:hypothetical protein